VKDPTRIPKICAMLQSLWVANPNLSFGQLIESVESLAWDGPFPNRDFSARLMNLPDEWLEHALNLAAKGPIKLSK
jgi:hypothetical protein